MQLTTETNSELHTTYFHAITVPTESEQDVCMNVQCPGQSLQTLLLQNCLRICTNHSQSSLCQLVAFNSTKKATQDNAHSGDNNFNSTSICRERRNVLNVSKPYKQNVTFHQSATEQFRSIARGAVNAATATTNVDKILLLLRNVHKTPTLRCSWMM